MTKAEPNKKEMRDMTISPEIFSSIDGSGPTFPRTTVALTLPRGPTSLPRPASHIAAAPERCG
jgi:hypothetical protein